MGELTGMELTVASCPEPMDVMGAAVTMRERLQLYLNGGHSAVIGLSSSSPNEYLGMLVCFDISTGKYTVVTLTV